MQGLFAIFTLIFLALPVTAQSWQGICTTVTDGDTIHVTPLDSPTPVKIRLWGIDAPERSQPHGPQATRALTKLLLNKRVTVTPVDRDRYGRTVAKISTGRTSAALYMLNRGHAWHAPKYAPDATKYAAAQQKARTKKRGLWAAPAPTEPWLYRKK